MTQHRRKDDPQQETQEPHRHVEPTDWQKLIREIKEGYYRVEGKRLSSWKLAKMIETRTGKEMQVYAILRLCDDANADARSYEGEQLKAWHRYYTCNSTPKSNSTLNDKRIS